MIPRPKFLIFAIASAWLATCAGCGGENTPTIWAFVSPNPASVNRGDSVTVFVGSNNPRLDLKGVSFRELPTGCSTRVLRGGGQIPFEVAIDSSGSTPLGEHRVRIVVDLVQQQPLVDDFITLTLIVQ